MDTCVGRWWTTCFLDSLVTLNQILESNLLQKNNGVFKKTMCLIIPNIILYQIQPKLCKIPGRGGDFNKGKFLHFVGIQFQAKEFIEGFLLIAFLIMKK